MKSVIMSDPNVKNSIEKLEKSENLESDLTTLISPELIEESSSGLFGVNDCDKCNFKFDDLIV